MGRAGASGWTPTLSAVSIPWRQARLDREYASWVARVLARLGCVLAGAALGVFLAVNTRGPGSWQFWTVIALGLAATALPETLIRFRRPRS